MAVRSLARVYVFFVKRQVRVRVRVRVGVRVGVRVRVRVRVSVRVNVRVRVRVRADAWMKCKCSVASFQSDLIFFFDVRIASECLEL